MVPSTGRRRRRGAAARPVPGEGAHCTHYPLNGCGTPNGALASVHAARGPRPRADGAAARRGKSRGLGGARAGGGKGQDGGSSGACAGVAATPRRGGVAGARGLPTGRFPGLCFPRAGRRPGADRNELPGQNWNPEPPVVVTRQPASRREVRRRNPPWRPAHARRLPPVSSLGGSPTAEWEGRACARAPLRFSAASSSRSWRERPLASVVQDWSFTWVCLKSPNSSPILRQEKTGRKKQRKQDNVSGRSFERPARQFNLRNLYPASIRKEHLIVQKINHAATTPGSPIRRGWATSSWDSSEHVLVQQTV